MDERAIVRDRELYSASAEDVDRRQHRNTRPRNRERLEIEGHRHHALKSPIPVEHVAGRDIAALGSAWADQFASAGLQVRDIEPVGSATEEGAPTRKHERPA